MKRFSALSLMLEFMGAVLAALLISNVALILLTLNQRDQEIRFARLDIAAARLATLIDILPSLTPAQQQQYLFAASGRGEKLDISATPIVSENEARLPDLEARMLGAFDMPRPLLRIALGISMPEKPPHPMPHLARPPHRLPGDARPPPKPPHPVKRLAIAIALADGHWLNVQFLLPPNNAAFGFVLHSIAITALALIVASIWMALRFAGPLRNLAQAATQMQPGEPAPQVREQGPRALRHVTRSFNAMSKRLMATLDSQRAMLAAIAHDLRTPITALKLRTELLDDEDVKERMQASLDELQSLTESALATLKSGGTDGEMRAVDLSALIESVCEDLHDMNLDAQFAEAPPLTCRCRPQDVRRALRNLIENAVRYGQRARVSLAREDKCALIKIEDDGPGIPAERIDAVFQPFERLDTSRSRETGGHGLGLTIARTIARAHGGDVTLENRAGGGLTATLKLALG